MSSFLPGERIKYLRKLSDMSQEELGRRVGVQRAAINKYEKGTVTNIPIPTIEKIASIFNVSPTFIVGWDSPSGNQLSIESKVLDAVSSIYGRDLVDLMETYVELSDEGKERVQTYAVDMWKVHQVIDITKPCK